MNEFPQATPAEIPRATPPRQRSSPPPYTSPSKPSNLPTAIPQTRSAPWIPTHVPNRATTSQRTRPPARQASRWTGLISGFGLFRGCLVIIVLVAIVSVVLFFGVPYAVEVMRETQRERNAEPPRFPIR